MEHFGQKIEAIKQKQQRSLENSQATIESSSASKKPQYILALGGVAAGLTIAVMLWLANAIMTKDNINMIAPGSAEAIHTIDIRKTTDNISRLNERVELITESIDNLEAKLTGIMAQTESITDSENKNASSSKQYMPESADADPAVDIEEPDTTRAVQMTPEAVTVFVPTHTVKTWLNLRPSSSLDSIPIAVLKAGSEVEYIREADGWYYVDTPLHGKGWCASEYLTPLSPTQQNTTVN